MFLSNLTNMLKLCGTQLHIHTYNMWLFLYQKKVRKATNLIQIILVFYTQHYCYCLSLRDSSEILKKKPLTDIPLSPKPPTPIIPSIPTHFVFKWFCCSNTVVVVQSHSHVRLFATPWTAACQASLSLTISWSLPKFMSIALVMPSSHLILWCPLVLLPLIFPSIRDFSNESAVCIKWSKYCSLSYSISPSEEYSGVMSLKIDWFDLLAVQESQESSPVPQFEWRCSAFFTVQLSQPYVTTGKTIA